MYHIPLPSLRLTVINNPLHAHTHPDKHPRSQHYAHHHPIPYEQLINLDPALPLFHILIMSPGAFPHRPFSL